MRKLEKRKVANLPDLQAPDLPSSITQNCIQTSAIQENIGRKPNGRQPETLYKLSTVKQFATGTTFSSGNPKIKRDKMLNNFYLKLLFFGYLAIIIICMENRSPIQRIHS